MSEFQQLSRHVTVLCHTGPGPDAEQREQLAALGVAVADGVWVAGNLTDPQAQVIGAAAGGLLAGAAINFDLVLEEVRLARSTGRNTQTVRDQDHPAEPARNPSSAP